MSTYRVTRVVMSELVAAVQAGTVPLDVLEPRFAELEKWIEHTGGAQVPGVTFEQRERRSA